MSNKKQFTLDNLRADHACADGMAFVTPIIESGECVASALLDNCHDEWFRWAMERDYDVEPARRTWRTWDEKGRVHATSGDGGTSTSGCGGTSTSGDGGTSTSGDGGTSTSGDGGTSTSGDGGTSTSGDGGTLIIKHWDGKRYRFVVGYIGEDGLKPNAPYKLDKDGKFVEAAN